MEFELETKSVRHTGIKLKDEMALRISKTNGRPVAAKRLTYVIYMIVLILNFLIWFKADGKSHSVLNHDNLVKEHRLEGVEGKSWRQLISDGILKIEVNNHQSNGISYLRFSKQGELSEKSLSASGPVLKTLARKWRLKYEGLLGDVRVSLNLSRLNLDREIASNISLLVDSDNDLSNGYEKLLPVASINNQTAVFQELDFGGSVYFTFATELVNLKFTREPMDKRSDETEDLKVKVSVINDLERLIPSREVSVVIGLVKKVNGKEILISKKQVKTINGEVDFGEMMVHRAGEDYRFFAQILGQPKVYSVPFKVLPGSPSAYKFLNLPKNIESGKLIKPGIKVAMMDGYGNQIIEFTGTVELEVYEEDSKKMLNSFSIDAENGVAEFNEVKLNNASRSLVFKAKSWGVRAAYSEPINLRKD